MHKWCKCETFATWASAVIQDRLLWLDIHSHRQQLARLVLDLKVATPILSQFEQAIYRMRLESDSIGRILTFSHIKIMLSAPKYLHKFIPISFKGVCSYREHRFLQRNPTNFKRLLWTERSRHNVEHFFWNTASCVLWNNLIIKELRKIRRLESFQSSLPRNSISLSRALSISYSIKIALISVHAINHFHDLTSSFCIEVCFVLEEVIAHKDIERNVSTWVVDVSVVKLVQ